MEEVNPVEMDVAQNQTQNVPSDFAPGKIIMQYLQETKSGATTEEIVRHLSHEVGQESKDLTRAVMFVLEHGTALGFLERKGSPEHLPVREARCKRRRRRRSCCKRRCCPRRRRRRRSCPRRRRKIRRRSCKRRRRRC